MRRGTPAAIKFGEIVRTLRLDKKLTMQDVADILETKPARVSQIEHAQRALKEECLSEYAKALGVDESFLLTTWLQCQAEPDPPIVRKRRKTVSPQDLNSIIAKLSSADRNRVLGYVEALIDGSE